MYTLIIKVVRNKSMRRLKKPVYLFFVTTAVTSLLIVIISSSNKRCETETPQTQQQQQQPTEDEQQSLSAYSSVFSAPVMFNRVEGSASVDPSQDQVPNTVVFVWCHREGQFRFINYLSVLSAVRFLHPDRIVLYYSHRPPQFDDLRYNTWLAEIENGYPFFSKVREPRVCRKRKTVDLAFVWRELGTEGGMYVRVDVLLTAGTRNYWRNGSTVAVDGRGRTALMMRRPGMTNKTEDEAIAGKQLWYKNTSLIETTRCVNNSHYDSLNKRFGKTSLNSTKAALKFHPLCIVQSNSLLPKDIWDLDSSLGQLLRTVAYGKPELAQPEPSYDTLVPNIGHVVWLGGGEMQFDFYICVLSLLNVAEVETLYVHGDVPPTGFYWNLTKNDPRIRFVRRAFSPNFGDASMTSNKAHIADLWRIDIMLQYGGIYLDTDAIFVRRLSTELRGYDAVGTLDLNTALYTEYPDHLNFGVTIGKPDSKFWQLMQQASRWYVKEDHFWLGVRMPYKIKERYPDSLRIDPHLQVLCFRGLCRPTWSPEYQNENVNQVTTDILKNWKNDTFAFHITWPTPDELTSHAALLSAEGLIADVGRMVLEKSGMIEYFRKLASDEQRLNDSHYVFDGPRSDDGIVN